MKKAIISVLVLVLVTAGAFAVYFGVHKSNDKISKQDASAIVDIDENDFEIINYYCEKSNKGSINKLDFYNELLVLELDISNMPQAEKSTFLSSFEDCEKQQELMSKLQGIADENEKQLWISNILGQESAWKRRTQSFENTNIKSSVNLYMLETDNSDKAFLILDQSSICGQDTIVIVESSLDTVSRLKIRRDF